MRQHKKRLVFFAQTFPMCFDIYIYYIQVTCVQARFSHDDYEGQTTPIGINHY